MPDAGDMSIELAPGKWLNITWSEWLTVSYEPEPRSRQDYIEDFLNGLQRRDGVS